MGEGGGEVGGNLRQLYEGFVTLEKFDAKILPNPPIFKVFLFHKLKNHTLKRLFLLLLLISNLASAQTSWLSLLPGLRTQTNYFNGDTLITIGVGAIGNPLIIEVNYSSLKTGQYYKTDTIDYYQISKDPYTSNEHRTAFQSIYDINTQKLTIGFNYLDTLKGQYKWQSAIFNTSPLLKLSYQLNHDTFSTKIEGYQKIGNNHYAIIAWENRIDQLSALISYKLVRLNKDSSTTLIKNQVNSNSSANAHMIWFESLKGDNKNQGILFLQQIDQWDWAGLPSSFQSEVIKMDTNGKTIWKCRPNNNDSVNTTQFHFVQKPNGNILCCWNDYYHPPHKHPTKDNPYEDVNDSSTIWFAEIDYQSGNVLWRKNIRRFLFSKYTTKEEPDRTRQDLLFYDAQLVNNNSIVWVGDRIGGFPEPFIWKRLAVILKTDLFGNPIWYREHEIIPGDTFEKGMQVFSFTQSPDKGFLLTGEIEVRNNAGRFQKAAILKLDSFGCRQQDCQKTDAVSKIESESKLCVIYPNPGSSNITIQLPKNKPCEYTLKIYATHGKLLDNISLDSDYILNTSEFNTGIYLFVITNSETNNSEIHKISIIR